MSQREAERSPVADASQGTAALTGEAPPAKRTDPSAVAEAASMASASTSAGPSMRRLGTLHTPLSAGAGAADAGASGVANPLRKSNYTKQGTQKMTFKPNMPLRRKVEVKEEPTTVSLSAGRGRGERGRGRGGERGRGRGRGLDTARAAQEMTASGPFAQGPALGGGKKARPVTVSVGGSRPPGLGPLGGPARATESKPLTSTSTSDKDPDKPVQSEKFSDDEDGIELMDMNTVGDLDEHAPVNLTEPSVHASVKSEAMDDASESEEEELMDDLMDDFVAREDSGQSPQDKIYLFQFPHLFPQFIDPQAAEDVKMKIDPDGAIKTEQTAATGEGAAAGTKVKRNVSFAPGTVGGEGAPEKGSPVASTTDDAGASASAVKTEKAEAKDPLAVKGAKKAIGPEGRVGTLQVYKSGKVCIKLGDILYDITSGSQASFLQQIMVMDPEKKKAVVMGEVARKFVATPNLDRLLEDLSV